MKPAVKTAITVCLALLTSHSIGAQAARLVSEEPGSPPQGLLSQYPAVVTHTHNWRFADGESVGSFEDAEKDLVAWCARLGIRAIGVGSAWDPDNDAMFRRFEGPDRDLYYSGKFDQRSVMQTGHIHRVIAHLNRLSAGRTWFYLDNETPKNRMGHVWWFNYFYDYPAWHDYSQDRPIRMYRDDPSIEINPLNGQPHTRRDLFEIMAIQHRAGALAVFAHPTRWWIGGGKFVTNIAALAGLFLVANGQLDGLAMMSDRPFNSSAQKLWLSFLDRGAVVPGFAETDFFLNKASERSGLETFRNYMHLSGKTTTAEHLRDAARTGESFASNGAFLTISVDGVPMGSICNTSAKRTHHVRVQAYPAPGSTLSLIQLVGLHGEVLAEKHGFSGGVLEFELAGSNDPRYVLARAFGAGDDPVDAPDKVREAAITNPVYLHPAGFHVSPAQTACTLHVPAGSRWVGGTIEFRRMSGGRIQIQKISPGIIRITLPANARIVLRKRGQPNANFSIALENAAVEKWISYLTSGRFRDDFPNLQQGVVPPEAFHLEELKKALAAFDYTLN
jgi:hypothetical protein